MDHRHSLADRIRTKSFFRNFPSTENAVHIPINHSRFNRSKVFLHARLEYYTARMIIHWSTVRRCPLWYTRDYWKLAPSLCRMCILLKWFSVFIHITVVLNYAKSTHRVPPGYSISGGWWITGSSRKISSAVCDDNWHSRHSGKYQFFVTGDRNGFLGKGMCAHGCLATVFLPLYCFLKNIPIDSG